MPWHIGTGLDHTFIFRISRAGVPSTVLNLVDCLRDSGGIEKNSRSLRPMLRSLMIARAITAELVAPGQGRVLC
nr:hypothetical protein [Cupriavidus sp. D39]